MLSGKATNTNFIVFGLTRSGLEPKAEHTNNYITNADALNNYSVDKDTGIYSNKIFYFNNLPDNNVILHD